MEQMLWQGLQCSWMMSRQSVPSLYTCSTRCRVKQGEDEATGPQARRLSAKAAVLGSREPVTIDDWQDLATAFATATHVRMEYLAGEAHSGWLVGVMLAKCDAQLKHSALPSSLHGPQD